LNSAEQHPEVRRFLLVFRTCKFDVFPLIRPCNHSGNIDASRGDCGETCIVFASGERVLCPCCIVDREKLPYLSVMKAQSHLLEFAHISNASAWHKSVPSCEQRDRGRGRHALSAHGIIKLQVNFQKLPLNLKKNKFASKIHLQSLPDVDRSRLSCVLPFYTI